VEFCSVQPVGGVTVAVGAAVVIWARRTSPGWVPAGPPEEVHEGVVQDVGTGWKQKIEERMGCVYDG